MNEHSPPRERHNRQVEPSAMTSPTTVLPWMVLFLILVVALVAALSSQLYAAFLNNPGFNAVILAILLFGIFINLLQVLKLQREVRWIEQYRRSDPLAPPFGKPQLLASMARLLRRLDKGQPKLSPLALRSILDSLAARLDEARDLSRYLTGVLIFLGLLGTFYGLLLTIRSVGDIIGSLSVGGDAASMFETLKSHLKAPLSGMGTSFSTSLFGLAGSLILGFQDLQTGHAQNRFYNETEEWLSDITHLSDIGTPGEGEA
ncbi:MAG: hypothetical protein PHE55_21915, partial [Methylococcaceae bacterium]|nr:hypothetical protein [Methylococcaceae bacterium]